MPPHEVQQGRCHAAAMALKAPPTWRSFLGMEIPFMGVARGITVVLAVGASSKTRSRPSTNGLYRFRDRSKSPCWESRQISAQMACPLAWATGSAKRPRRLMKWSRPSSLNLTWSAPLLSLTLGGFFSIPLLYMGFGLRADTPNAKPDQQIQ